MEQYMWIIWLSLFVVMIIIEAIGPELITLWFGFGALVAMIVSFIPNVPWWVEAIVFVAVSLATLFALRPLAKKYFKRNVVRSNADSLIGRKGIIIEPISLLKPGSCKINDVTWTAVAVDENESIGKGEVVEVVALSGNKLIVKKKEVQ
ncbi:MAG: NfeD family protein [Erysipelotrichaceae bacterium]|nr:NfeD family protein [Erysipelotrichaceae bacterium]